MDQSSPSEGLAGAEATGRQEGRSTSNVSNLSNVSTSSVSSTAQAAPGQAPPRSPSMSSISRSSHRQSFVEGLRNIPPSPRQRHASFTQSAIQDLLIHPSGGKHANPQFAGREWREITLGELVSRNDVKWANMDSSVEEATMLLLKSQPNVVLLRENAESKTPVSTFDFKDLNAYLLVVVGLAHPEEDQVEASNAVVGKAQKGESIMLREVQPLFRKESLMTLRSSSSLSQAIEIMGSGIHRIVVNNEEDEVIGIVSQLRLLEFFWDEGINFPSIDQLYPLVLHDLNIGTKQTISVNSDAPLSDALVLMNDEGLTSVPVVDNGLNVVGNISTKDVRHLTSASSAPLLKGSCMHFISVILNERGVEEGRDTFPVFYVNPNSTLAHTVAKLVATRSHRMWVVESASASPSAPATPLAGPHSFPGAPATTTGGAPPSPAAAPAVSASAMAGARLSGRLNGVISLTDILNTFAKSTGLHPLDPGEQRARRRKSSSSSIRASIDSSSRGPSMDIRR